MAYNELTTPIDRVSKLLFRAYPDLVVNLAFPGQAVRVISVEENVEINLPTRPVDTVMIIATTEEGVYRKLALHLEYYVKHEPDVPQMLFIYSAELTDRMQMPVITVGSIQNGDGSDHARNRNMSLSLAGGSSTAFSILTSGSSITLTRFVPVS